jgi:tetratricopeptide (TPR) repeat protein
VIGAGVAALAYGGFIEMRRLAYSARLPPLPVFSTRRGAIRAHLSGADRAARAHPTSPDIVGALGIAYHADLFYEQAEHCYRLAEELSDDWHWTYYRALTAGALGDADALVGALRRVVNAAPGFGPGWWQLGEAEFKAGHFDEAERAWRRATNATESPQPPTSGLPARKRTASVSAYAWLGVARVAIVEGQPDRARKMLEEIVASNPSFGPAFNLLATAYSALGRPEDAERALRAADRLPAYDPYSDPMVDPLVRESRNATFLLQQAAASALDTNAAWREYLVRRVLEVEPDNADALHELASMLRALRRYDEALAVLERLRRLVPGDFQALVEIGRCLVGLQRFGEGESVLRRALEGLDDADAHFHLGAALDRQGRLPEAIGEYKRALERNPNHRDALNYFGVSLVREGKFDQAAREFERLLATDPDNADAHTNLGAVFLTQRKDRLAEREFRAALQVSPGHALAREGLQKLRR